MDFRTYEGDIDYGAIGFAVVMLGLCGLLFLFLYTAITVSNKREDERKTFKEACIDAGGYPVSPFDYVKGHGAGYLCINPSAIIELK